MPSVSGGSPFQVPSEKSPVPLFGGTAFFAAYTVRVLTVAVTRGGEGNLELWLLQFVD